MFSDLFFSPVNGAEAVVAKDVLLRDRPRRRPYSHRNVNIAVAKSPMLKELPKRLGDPAGYVRASAVADLGKIACEIRGGKVVVSAAR